jgi:hypothetical protein
MIRIIKKTPSRKQIRKWVRELDSRLSEDEPAFDAACVLLASAYHGPNADRCAKLLQLPRAQVREWGRNLAVSGVWQNGKVCANWDDEKLGAIEFWCDANVALGLMERVAE